MKYRGLACAAVLLTVSLGQQALAAGAAHLPDALLGTWLMTPDAAELSSCDGLRNKHAESMTITSDGIVETWSTSRVTSIDELSAEPQLWRLDIVEESEGDIYEYPLIAMLIGEYLTTIGSANVDRIDVPVVHTYARC